VLLAFVLGLDEALGFIAAGGAEGDLFAGLSVLAIEDAPAAAKQTVTLFHVHVLSMNLLAGAALARS